MYKVAILVGLLLVVGIIGVFLMRKKEKFVHKHKDEQLILLIHSPRCGHCTAMMPEWDEFEKLPFNTKKINGDENVDIAQKHNVTGYPTVLYLPHGINDNSGAVTFDGERTASSLEKFASMNVK